MVKRDDVTVIFSLRVVVFLKVYPPPCALCATHPGPVTFAGLFFYLVFNEIAHSAEKKVGRAFATTGPHGVLPLRPHLGHTSGWLRVKGWRTILDAYATD